MGKVVMKKLNQLTVTNNLYLSLLNISYKFLAMRKSLTLIIDFTLNKGNDILIDKMVF